MKAKSTIKRRNRDAGQIEKEAVKDVGTALQRALYGRKRTLAAQAVWIYRVCEKNRKPLDVKAVDPARLKEAVGEMADLVVRFGLSAGYLCKVFLEAVEKRDGNALREMAGALEMVELHPKPLDWKRLHILNLRGLFDNESDYWTAKQLAGWLEYPDYPIGSLREAGRRAEARAPESDDGYSDVRRLAKRLKFPLAKGKTGRPKKADLKVK